MTQPVGGQQHDVGERWNVNVPAVIGLVVALLVGVVVWVIVSGGDDGPADGRQVATPTAPTTVGTVGSSTPVATPLRDGSGAPGTTSPAPMPDPSSVATSDPPRAIPVTVAPGADADAVPGDLGVPGRPMERPGCHESFITVLASAIGGQATAAGIAAVLDAYPGSNYLRTDQTCPSLTPDIDGEPIYVVYFGPYALASDACVALADGSEGAYVRRLSTEVGPDHGVACT